MKNPAASLERANARLLLFKILSCLWIFPSAGAVWILVQSAVKSQNRGLEQWVALALLAIHLMFVCLALQNGFRARRIESHIEKSAQAVNTDIAN
jgi:hypothetical protein